MKLAVFDLDHTLLPIDCEWGWVEYMLAAGGVLDVVAIYSLRDQLYRDYAEGKLDYDAFGDFQMEILARFPRQSLDRWIEDYASRCINPVITEAARNLVESHRKSGDILVLCTAAYGYIAQPIARLFGIEHVLSAEVEIGADGEFTGRAEGPHNFSTNKPMRLQQFIDAVQTDNRSLEALSFYSDSASDMPMFDFTAKHHGTCVAVNPSPALARIAAERGWQKMMLYSSEDSKRAETVRLAVIKELKQNLRTDV